MTDGRRALLWALLMAFCGGVLALRLPSVPVETSLFALLPPDTEAPELAEAALALREQAQGRVAFLVGHADPVRAAAAADALAAGLRGLPGLEELRAEIPGDGAAALLDFYGPHQALLLLPEDLARVQAGPAALAESALKTLYLPPGLSGSLGFERDPFGQAGRWLAARQGAAGALRLRDGRLWTEGEGKQWTLVSAELRHRPRGFGAARGLEQGLDAARAAALAEPGTEVLRAGFIFHELAAARQAQQEAGTIGTVSALALFAMLWAAFRRWRAVGLVFVPVLAGCLMATAAVLLLGGPLYLITVVFGSTIVGVGEDYGLHLLSGLYEDGRWNPAKRLKEVRRGLWLALGTSWLGYAALFLVPIAAVRQVGVFSCLGLGGAWLTTVWLFPWATRGLPKAPPQSRRGVERLAAAWPRLRGRRGALLALVLLAVMLGGWRRLAGNDDVRLLYARDAALQSEQARGEQLLRLPGDGRFFAIQSGDTASVLAAEETLRARLARLEPSLPPALGVSLFVPSPPAQARARDAWKRSLPAAARAVQEQLGEPGLARRLRRTIADQSEPLSLDAWLASPLSAPFRHLWRGGRRPLAVLLLPAGSKAGAADLRSLAKDLRGVRYVDPMGSLAAELGRMRRHLSLGLALGSLAVIVALFAAMGRSAGRAVAPTLLGVGLGVAALGWAGLPLNLFAVLAVALILGMGVDYGIFVQESRGGGEPAALMAISVGAASNLAAFGLLVFSTTLALKVIGLVLSVGLGAAWLSALSFGSSPRRRRHA